ncbi:DUF3303 domain-containing protein [Acinetobacter zhairhuonensis]|uniref:DUF3303 domain-containing protein n=1 Tax=Acinetobacter sp. A7.4 TaxID=2919921 RepID=UPI001F4F3D34|nr:DUF3303 family protein [Acinetobacter sp. A7.4]MCJ8162704.1 DUF3303 domain-containing protein [Acinetobacter sp. A7.4]
MLFIFKWSSRPENRNAAIERFLKTGGKPPAGVNMLGRWFVVAQQSGFAVAEADDAGLLQQWAMEWNDLLSMEVLPALTDEQAGPLMAAALGK